MTSVSDEASPGESGPSTVLGRSPWPTIISARPGSRLAAAHTMHLEGRAAAHDSVAIAQDLTSSSECTIRELLRGSVSNVIRGARRGWCSIHCPRHLFCRAGSVPMLRLQALIYDRPGGRARNQRQRWRSAVARCQAHHAPRARTAPRPSTTARPNSCPNCGYPSPDFRESCRDCGYPHGRA